MTWAWGVDVAVSHLEFAFADMNSDLIRVESLITRTDAKEGERLGLIDRQVRIYAEQSPYDAHVIWVEQPSGAVSSPQLVYVAGVVQAALFESLRCPVWTVTSGHWKKLAVGFGNASPEQYAAWCDRMGFGFDGFDQAAAIGIAFAGRRMVQTGLWSGLEAA